MQQKSCDLCYRRKMKCDGQKPRCSHCVTYEIGCTYGAPSRTPAPKKGWKKALKENAALLKGLNIVDGKVTYPAVAEAFALPYTPPDSYLN